MTTYTPKYKYTYKKEPLDLRDLKFDKEVAQLTIIPSKFDLRDTGNVPPVLDQLTLNSCVANAASNSLMICLKKEKLQVFTPSRLYIYYFCRLIENTVNQDPGCYVRTALTELRTYGVCDETLWPYYISRYPIRPNNVCVRQGLTHIPGFAYMSVNQDINQIKNALAQGYSIICGVKVYQSFESDKALTTGEIPMADPQKEPLLGGHAILLIGYDDSTKRFLFMNSWGTSVGDKGFFTIPYDYISRTDLAFDFWVIVFFK